MSLLLLFNGQGASTTGGYRSYFGWWDGGFAGEAGGTNYDESGRILSTILAQTAATDIQAMVENGKVLATILYQQGETDSLAITQASLAVVLLALMGATDVAAFVESPSVTVLAQTGHTSNATLLEALSSLILVQTGETDRADFVELNLLQIILAVMGETDLFGDSAIAKLNAVDNTHKLSADPEFGKLVAAVVEKITASWSGD